MAFDLDTSGVSEGDLQGFDIPAEGTYLLAVTMIDDSLSKYKSIVAEMQVISGTVPGQSGLEFRDFFSLTEKSIRRTTRLAIVLGLMRREDVGKQVTLDWQQGCGRLIVGKVVHDEYTADDGQLKTKAKLDFLGFWSPDDPRVIAVPKDAAALKIAGYDPAKLNAPPASAPPVSAPARQDAQATAAAAEPPASDPFGDLGI